MVRGGVDTWLTPAAANIAGAVSAPSATASNLELVDDDASSAIRRAIGGDASARAWIGRRADTTTDPAVIVMASLLDRRADRLARADQHALSTRDRQVVAIARAHLRGARELVDALARDHLVDHPDSYLVAWIAADSAWAPAVGAVVASTEVDHPTGELDELDERDGP